MSWPWSTTSGCIKCGQIIVSLRESFIEQSKKAANNVLTENGREAEEDDDDLWENLDNFAHGMVGP